MTTFASHEAVEGLEFIAPDIAVTGDFAKSEISNSATPLDAPGVVGAYPEVTTQEILDGAAQTLTVVDRAVERNGQIDIATLLGEATGLHAYEDNPEVSLKDRMHKLTGWLTMVNMIPKGPDGERSGFSTQPFKRGIGTDLFEIIPDIITKAKEEQLLPELSKNTSHMVGILCVAATHVVTAFPANYRNSSSDYERAFYEKQRDKAKDFTDTVLTNLFPRTDYSTPNHVTAKQNAASKASS